MKKFALAVHGGAGPDSEFIKQHQKEYKKGLEDALNAGYAILEKGGSAIEAVEAAVRSMEDNELFNAGKGAALNEKAEVEMCSSIVDGKNIKMGAVALVKNVRNPISLARLVMEKTDHIYLGDQGALDFAMEVHAPIEPDAYFITPHQYEAYAEKREKAAKDPREAALEQVESRNHGTVGAVALDQEGNVAAATSTGGTEHCKRGRIGDSSMVGVGSYADNRTCAVSTTGEGESLIRHISAFHISALMDYKGLSLEEAVDYFFNDRCKDEKGDMGMITINRKGQIVFKFNSERMHRGCKTSAGELVVEIY